MSDRSQGTRIGEAKLTRRGRHVESFVSKGVFSNSAAIVRSPLRAQASTPTLSRETPEVQAWVQLLRAHAALTRRFSSDLLGEHGLTLNDYEVLLHLAHAPERRLRPVDLAESILLTPSGITRLLAGLERAGYIDRAACPGDARVSYAVLTEHGYEKLRAAAPSHLGAIRELFGERFSGDELETLASLLGRLPVFGGGPECEPPDS
jgi:DNA-binding MarR family transcriptional regulator